MELDLNLWLYSFFFQFCQCFSDYVYDFIWSWYLQFLKFVCDYEVELNSFFVIFFFSYQKQGSLRLSKLFFRDVVIGVRLRGQCFVIISVGMII